MSGFAATRRAFRSISPALRLALASLLAQIMSQLYLWPDAIR